jgi:hypothetical protein
MKKYTFPCGCIIEQRGKGASACIFKKSCAKGKAGMHQMMWVMAVLPAFTSSMRVREEFRYTEENLPV